jgi:hypothetical protein
VRQHRRDVEAPVADQLQVQRNGVETAPLEVLHAEGVRAGDGDLLEVDRGRFPAFGRGHTGVDQPASFGQDAHAHLEGLGLGDGVVDHVDVPGMRDGQPVQREVQDGARPGGELLDELEPGLVGEHGVRPEPQRHLALGLEAGDDADLDPWVQRFEDSHARQPEGARPVDEHPPRRGRRVPHNGVERDREGIGQHGGLVRDAVGNRNQHGVVRGQLFGPGAGRSRDDADVHARAEITLGEAPTQAEVTCLAGRAQRRDAAWRAGQPGIEDDALAHVEPAGLGPERHDLGDDFVPRHVGQGGEGGHWVVDVARVEITEHELGVGPADAREDRPGHHPVGTDESGVVDVVQAERDTRQHGLQLVLGSGPGFLLVRWCAEEQRLHCSVPSEPPNRRMPTMKLSMSDVLASMIAFMSGR